MVTVVAEYRLHRAEALVIKGLAGRAIDLLFHLLGHGIGMVTTGTLEEGNLTHFGALGVSQTLVAQRARQTIALGPPVLDSLVTMQIVVGAISVE